MSEVGGRRRRVACAGLVVVALVSTACGHSSPASTMGREPDTAQPLPADSRVIAMGLAAPWAVAFYGTTPLVSERDNGRIVEVVGEGHTREVATVAGVDGAGEGGLLGIATHDRYLYAYYTAGAENRVARFPISGVPGALSLGRRERILDGIPAAANHDGGRIAFGPDGMLYATTGDAGRPRLAQDVDSLAGKILRMTPVGGVPPDNPFPGSVVYSMGHRNVQGIAWAPDHRMFASEFGADKADELNLIEPGRNYGWPGAEGFARRDGYVDPLQTWAPEDASPSGIAVVDGAVVIANLRGERIRTVPLTNLSASVDSHAGEFGRLRDVVAAPDGSIWVLTNNTDGRGAPGAGDDRIVRLGRVTGPA